MDLLLDVITVQVLDESKSFLVPHTRKGDFKRVLEEASWMRAVVESSSYEEFKLSNKDADNVSADVYNMLQVCACKVDIAKSVFEFIKNNEFEVACNVELKLK